MECIYCSNKKTRVTDKRDSPKGIRRRRECLRCKKRFTTYEKPYEPIIFVIKKNGIKEKFNEEKIKKGLLKAFEKRGFSDNQLEQIINDIKKDLRKKGKKEIKSSEIGEKVIKKIKKIDKVAYLRFNSVYKNFKNKEDFKKALKEF